MQITVPSTIGSNPVTIIINGVPYKLGAGAAAGGRDRRRGPADAHEARRLLGRPDRRDPDAGMAGGLPRVGDRRRQLLRGGDCHGACSGLGGVLGVVGMFFMPDFPARDVLNAIAIGIVSGLASTGCNELVKQLRE